jgi:putative transposase
MQVSRSGFYKHVKTIKKPDLLLMITMKAIAQESRFSYGKRRMSQSLKQNGFNFGVFATRTLMLKFDIQCHKKRTYRIWKNNQHTQPATDNILKRNFITNQPNTAWVADITTIKTSQGPIYLATVLDLFSRKIIGWCIEDNMKETITISALNMAFKKRSPKSQILHHSDQGSQYRSLCYTRLLGKFKMISSMNRKGNCLDNAVMERFFSSLKRERTSLQTYTTRNQAKLDVIDYIENFYNTKRLHSFLGYISPNQFEQRAVPVKLSTLT